MAAIQTLGELQTLQTGWSPLVVRTGLRMYDAYNYDYASLYRMQPNIRTCVDFLARNIAQLGLHVFRRVSDTDRERLTDHPLAQLLAQPLPPAAKMTYYRLIESLISDMGIYFNAYWLKLRQGVRLSGLLRLPPIYMSVEGGLIPKSYTLTIAGRPLNYAPEQVVHFRGYNPENPISGLSPLETLRRVLAEEHEAGLYRENFWQNAARREGLVKRPKDAPAWSETARERFIAEFGELHAGADNSGKIVVLEEGMEWQDTSFNAQESEYLAGRKLTREECARAYHIPLPMVGILDHATFSNITEQHKNLYQDSLGPWLSMIEQDIGLQLTPEFEDTDGVYTEFNIHEKLQGSFEDQTKTLQSAVGRPWMTPNEARARMNLPRDPDPNSDQLATPLNVLIGGQASPRDTAPDEGGPKMFARKRFDPASPELRARHQQKWVEVLARHYRRQEAAIVSRIPPAIGTEHDSGKSLIGNIWYDDERWNGELAADLLRLNRLTASAWADRLLEQTEAEIDREAFDARMDIWLSEHAGVQAANINAYMLGELTRAIDDPDPLAAVKGVFTAAITVWALRQAESAITTASNFGSVEAASAAALRTKSWHVTSGNPRESHAAMNGETVGIRELFSNGLRWPGDPHGGAEDNANCQCTVSFS